MKFSGGDKSTFTQKGDNMTDHIKMAAVDIDGTFVRSDYTYRRRRRACYFRKGFLLKEKLYISGIITGDGWFTKMSVPVIISTD